MLGELGLFGLRLGSGPGRDHDRDAHDRERSEKGEKRKRAEEEPRRLGLAPRATLPRLPGGPTARHRANIILGLRPGPPGPWRREVALALHGITVRLDPAQCNNWARPVAPPTGLRGSRLRNDYPPP